jgi:hypothetical protein
MVMMMMIMMADISNVTQCLNVHRIHFRQYGVYQVYPMPLRHIAWRFSTVAALRSCQLLHFDGWNYKIPHPFLILTTSS